MLVYCLHMSLCLPRVVSFPNLLENNYLYWFAGHMVEGQNCVCLIYYDLFFVHLSNQIKYSNWKCRVDYFLSIFRSPGQMPRSDIISLSKMLSIRSLITHDHSFKNNSTTVIAKIKGMPRSFFYDIPCYVIMDYEKWYTSILLTQCEEIRAFEVQNHANYM